MDRLVTVVLLGVLLLLAAAVSGCDAELAEATYFAEDAGTSARVWIPVDEARSIGTYRAEIAWPGGRTDHIQGQRDGMLAGVWVVDMRDDGEPELVVAMSSSGSGSYGSVHVHERQDDVLTQVELPELGGAERTGYMGHDVFSVEAGRLYRMFPRYEEGDPNAAPSGGTAYFWYSSEADAWVEEDSTTVRQRQ